MSQTPFSSLNYSTKFKCNFLKKKGSTGISKNLHASSKHSLLLESEKKPVSVFKTYFIAEVNNENYLQRIQGISQVHIEPDTEDTEILQGTCSVHKH